ncbi:hypothetical protein DPMN_016836 [Dreissena polymorpha]|uniref:Uncharacterized protein n=1 Tax=Dreissena polymorpha TaxID=45954 RepID=A0A9D4S6S6_DREPO|nr:hypothetical protein DPMN_016836 [Dreissena polymorpha]
MNLDGRVIQAGGFLLQESRGSVVRALLRSLSQHHGRQFKSTANQRGNKRSGKLPVRRSYIGPEASAARNVS